MSNQINEGAARYNDNTSHSREGGDLPEFSGTQGTQIPQQLITDHLDLWTSTVTPKSTSGRGRGSGKNSKLELTGIKKLRELILELAVRGKLVEQNPNDEPASKLLERIEAEKAQLIKDGKLKKQKPLAAVSEDEKPFELPQGWEWIRFNEVIIRISNGFGGKQDKSGNGYPLSRIETISESVVDQTRVGYTRDLPDDKLEYYKLKNEDLLFSHINSDFHLGKTAIFRSSEDLYHGVNLLLIRLSEHVSSDYFNFSIMALRWSGYFLKIAQHAIGQASVNQKKVSNIVVPLPSIEQQFRIVAKVDELMALCDQLEQQSEHQLTAHQQLTGTLLATLTESTNAQELNDNWQRLAQHFDLLFSGPMGAWAIDRLKDTILQLAVMGKLVPQNPDDEPASKLLERIEEEKARLVKEGKIKKPKKLPPVSDDEKPFELPEGWEWSRIGKVANACDYGTSVKSSTSANGIPVVSMGQIQNGSILLENLKSIPTNTPEIDTLLLKYGDLLYNRTNSAELVGKTGIFLGNSDKYTYASYLIRIRLSHATTEPFYINHVMNSPRFREIEIFPHVKQQCGQANVNGTIMQNMRIPIPPLAEQQRIVAKVDELFALCDQLKDRLQQASETEQHLTNAIVEQALG